LAVLFCQGLEDIRLDGEIEFIFDRPAVRRSNHGETLQKARLQHVAILTPCQGPSPLLRTPTYQYRKFSVSVKRHMSCLGMATEAPDSRVQRKMLHSCNVAYIRCIALLKRLSALKGTFVTSPTVHPLDPTCPRANNVPSVTCVDVEPSRMLGSH